MKVRIGVRGSIIVDHDVHPLNINTTTKNISCDKDALFESFERGVSRDAGQKCQLSTTGTESRSSIPFFLSKARVNSDRRKIARNEQFVQFDRPRNGFNENYNLF